MPETVIWWLRRDLRLHDNPVLTEGLQRGGSVIPAFIIDDRLFGSPYVSVNRTAFLIEGLCRLDSSLRSRGSYLVIRKGDPVQELKRLLVETHATASILAEPDYSQRVDKPDSLAILGRWQTEALRKQGATPEIGSKLGTLFEQAGIELIETGPLRGRGSSPLAPDEQDMEWGVLEADLAGMVPDQDILRMKKLDERAWRSGKQDQRGNHGSHHRSLL